MMKKIVFLLVFISIKTFSQTTVFSKRYLMPYHYCEGTSCGNPQNHITSFAESDDGINWTVVADLPVLSGSVPDAVIRGSELYLFNPGTVKVYNSGTKTFGSSAKVTIKDSLNNTVNFVDPSPIIDSDGNIVLFYLNSTGISGDPASCSTFPCIKYFDSAIEVPGSKGTEFLQQKGHRLSLTLNSGSGSDPDIYFDGTQYIMYVSAGSNVNAYYSTTLHGDYSAFPMLTNNGQLTNVGGIPCGHFDTTSSQYLTYVHANNNGATEIRLIQHSDFSSLVTSYTTVLTGTTAGLGASYSVASPGFLENTLETGTSYQNFTPPSFSIFPNPSSTVVKLNLPYNHHYTNLKISNLASDIVLIQEDDLSVIDISSLSNGIYFVSIIDSTINQPLNCKLIKH